MRLRLAVTVALWAFLGAGLAMVPGFVLIIIDEMAGKPQFSVQVLSFICFISVGAIVGAVIGMVAGRDAK